MFVVGMFRDGEEGKYLSIFITHTVIRNSSLQTGCLAVGPL